MAPGSRAMPLGPSPLRNGSFADWQGFLESRMITRKQFSLCNSTRSSVLIGDPLLSAILDIYINVLTP